MRGLMATGRSGEIIEDARFTSNFREGLTVTREVTFTRTQGARRGLRDTAAQATGPTPAYLTAAVGRVSQELHVVRRIQIGGTVKVHRRDVRWSRAGG